MSENLGDYVEDSELDHKFPTQAADGTPTTFSGSPVVSCYKANGTTQSTAGITLTVDFDSVTGLNHINVDLSADAFYATGEDYQLVITTGTVDGTSVVGQVVGTFSIENRVAKDAVTHLDDIKGTGWVSTDNLKAMDDRLAALQAGVDVISILGSGLSESTSGRIAGNISTFYDNADAATTSVVDDVGGGGGASVTDIWTYSTRGLTTTEQETLADTVLGRSYSHTETTHTKYCLKHLLSLVFTGDTTTSAGSITCFETDLSTQYAQATVTGDSAADPVVSVKQS